MALGSDGHVDLDHLYNLVKSREGTKKDQNSQFQARFGLCNELVQVVNLDESIASWRHTMRKQADGCTVTIRD